MDAACAPRVGGTGACVHAASLVRGAGLRRLSRGAGAEDDGACGEQEAACEGKHQ